MTPTGRAAIRRMCWVVGDRAITGSAASASQMGRFETKWLSRPWHAADRHTSARFVQVVDIDVNLVSPYNLQPKAPTAILRS